MNKCKIKFIATAVCSITVLCLFLFVGCGKKSKTEISIDSSNSPRLTYVLGQELDLSVGLLRVKTEKNESLIPLNSEGVSISGYDKNLIGEQTVTVSYKGKTTSFSVNVVPRMAAHGYEDEYFVGEGFNSLEGSLKITRDDGSYFTVSLGDPDVEISGFDSTNAGEITVSAKYSDESGVEYETSFNVTVYTVGQVQVSYPQKTLYESHETEMSLEDAYFTVSCGNGSGFSKRISITPDMVSGFNPSDATIENAKEPMKQTVTFSHLGFSFNFEITVLYGSVATIKYNSSLLSHIDWSKSDVTVTDAEYELALDLITEYYLLGASDKEYISREIATIIVRPATLYISRLFKAESESFNESFAINSQNGKILLVGGSYDKAKADLVRLKDGNEKFNIYASLLRRIKKDFGDIDLYLGTLIGEYINVPTNNEQSQCIKAFELLIALYDIFSKIPGEYTVDTLSDYGIDIDSAVNLIFDYDLTGPDYDYVFNVLKNWREDIDFFEVIYAYYCYVAEGGRGIIFDRLWHKLPLPGILQDWYLSLYSAAKEAQYMENNKGNKAYLYDTTAFMYYYFETVRIREEIKSSENTFIKDIYEIINGDFVFENNIRKAPGGYIIHTGAMLGTKAHSDLWESYLAIISLMRDGSLDFSENRNLFDTLLDRLTNLSPKELFGFISSLRFGYGDKMCDSLAFDLSGEANNSLSALLSDYYSSCLSESGYSAFSKLLSAMEYYSLYCEYESDANALIGFKSSFLSAKELYDSLEASEKEEIDSLYNKYLGIYNLIDGGGIGDAPEPDEWSDKRDELISTLDTYFSVAKLLSDGTVSDGEKETLYILLFSLYERADNIYNELISTSDANLIAKLFTKKYRIAGADGTIDSAFYSAKGIFVSYMLALNFVFEDENGVEVKYLAWDIYSKTSLSEFLRFASYVIEAGFSGAGLDNSYVKEVMSSFLSLGATEKKLLYMFNPTLYHNALESFFEEAFNTDDNLLALAKAIFKTELSYIRYIKDSEDTEALESFKNNARDATVLYGLVSDSALFNEYLKEIYDYYIQKYDSLVLEN